MPVYLKYADIKGGVTADGFTDQIELTNVSYGGARSAHPNVGRANSDEAGLPRLGEVAVSKEVDAASVLLFQAFTKRTVKDAVISFTRTKDGGGVEVLKEVTLTNATITSIGSNGNATSATESLTFGFSKIAEKYQPMAVGGTDASPLTAGFDLATSKPT